jgi:hypothetical protein
VATVNEHDVEQLKRIVARIEASPHGQESDRSPLRGTAFLITRRFALTCAHCLHEPDARTPFATRVSLYFQDWSSAEQQRSANVIGEPDWEHDVALLELHEEAPADIRLFPLCENAGVDDKWNSQASPVALNNNVLMRISGKVNSPSQSHTDDPSRKVLALECDQIKQIEDKLHGTSGGPVLVDGLIVGILLAQLIKAVDRTSYSSPGLLAPLYAFIYAQPIGPLRQFLTPLVPSVEIKPRVSKKPQFPDSNLGSLWEKIRKSWIEDVLANSLHDVIKLELGMQYDRAIDNPLKRVIDLADKSSRPLPSNKRVIDIFDEADGFLLILGEPGSGKTISLLELTRDLLAYAAADPGRPIPVVLPLSTWKESDVSLTSWIVREVQSLYYIGSRFTKAWLKKSRLLLMLDGLDEVKKEARLGCVKAINSYLEEGTPAGVVVSCRSSEYEALQMQLKFKAAIKLLPLTDDQIDRYLDLPGLESIRAAVTSDTTLRELAQSPLVLNIMVLAYKDEHGRIAIERGITTNQLRRDLMNHYIAKMFERKSKDERPYSDETVKHGLSWLARRLVERSQTVFLIESLQPDWLAGRAAWVAYWIGSRVAWAFSYGVFVTIISTLREVRLGKTFSIPELAAWACTVTFIASSFGLITGLFDGRLYEMHKSKSSGMGKHFLLRMLRYDAGYVLFSVVFAIALLAVGLPADSFQFWLMIGQMLVIGLLCLGPVAAFRSIKRDAYGDIRTAAFGWSWKRVEKGYIWGTIVGITLVCITVPIALVTLKLNTFPIVIGAGAAGSCLALILVAGPYLKRRGLPGSFLSKIGIENYVQASIRLILSSVVLVILVMVSFWLLLPGVAAFPKVVQGIGILLLTSVGVGMYCGILGASFSGIKSNTIESTVAPNQGIKLTIRHSLVSGMLVFLMGISLIYVPNLLFKRNVNPHVVTFFAVSTCFWYGTSVLRHFILRSILYYQGYLPRHLALFLDYATSLIFLQKVGGGYVFIHRLVMEHFASLREVDEESQHSSMVATAKNENPSLV